MKTNHFILLTGGAGSRMGESKPKQFLNILGKPLMFHSLHSLGQWNQNSSQPGGLICVAHKDYIDETTSAIQEITHLFSFFYVVEGGKTRHDSTKNGIQKLKPYVNKNDLIFIHDGARPLVESAELNRLQTCFHDSSTMIASLALPVHETVVRTSEYQNRVYYSEPVDRQNLYTIKTPQAMAAALIDQFLSEQSNPSITDLLTWSAGRHKCELALSTFQNIKVTTPEDLDTVRDMLI